MKKLIFIYLLVAIAYCKAADPDASWHKAVQHIPNLKQVEALSLPKKQIGAIPDNLNFPRLRMLSLNNNLIGAIPADLKSPRLAWLYLKNNQLEHIDPEIFKHFPLLGYIDLSNNPLTQNNINELREAAAVTGRDIEIIANDLIPTGEYIKGD